MAKNIVFIGMRGSGKTAVAAALAEKLKRTHVDIYKLIMQTYFTNIDVMIEKKGMEYFRDREADIIERVSKMENTVISTGSGLVVRPKNLERLKRNGIVVLLTAPTDVLLKRIGEHPLFLPHFSKVPNIRHEMEEDLRNWGPLYKEAADVTYSTERKSPGESAGEIFQLLKDKQLI